MRDPKWLGLTAALALALAPAPARAEGPAQAPNLETLRKELDEARKEIDELRRGTASSFQAAQKTVGALREEVARLRKEVADLRRQQSSTPQVSRFGPAPSATIRLINDQQETMVVVVNNTTYVLVPGQTRLLRDQAPGTFTYQVIGVQRRVVRDLRAAEMFTIRIYPL